jgi:hypothetical protein
VHLGLRTLGGNPDAFYTLDLERQIAVLACLTLELERAEPARPRGRGKGTMPQLVSYASEEAREYWSHAFRS